MNTPESLHAIFCKETQRESNFKVWERAYADFLSKGYTADDLSLVLRYILRENKRMNGAAFSLRQNKLFDFEYMHFDSLLTEARAKERNRKKPETAEAKIQRQYEQIVAPEAVVPNGGGRHLKDILGSIGN